MRNLLESNYKAAFSVSDKANENLTGGVVLWGIPSQHSCAFNPIVFTRTKYLHRTDTYKPTQAVVPNIIGFDNASVKLVFEQPLRSALSITVMTDIGDIVCNVAAGNKEWLLSSKCTTIISVLAVSLYGGVPQDYAIDNYFIYLRAGAEFQNSNFICSKAGDVLYKDTRVESVYLNVYKADGTFDTITAESYKGITRFDVSALVRTWLSQTLAEINDDIEQTDPALAVKFMVKGLGGSGWSQEFLALNAVAQVGESSDRTRYIGKVLTSFERLSYYKDYKLDYSILGGTQPIETARCEIAEMAVSRIRVNDTEEPVLDHAFNEILDDKGEAIMSLPGFDIKVFARKTPAHPFYVRWINRLGGVDYFMFSLRQKVGASIKSPSTYTPYIKDTSSARFNIRSYAISTENVVTIGAEGLNDNEYQALSCLPYSPLIEWYDESRGIWVVLSISKFDGTHSRQDATKSIEMTLTLPSTNTQF